MIGYRLIRLRNRLSKLRLAGHTCPERRPIGRIEMGEVVFEIDRVKFSQGYLVLTGTAGASTAGRVEGHVRIYGVDDVVAFRGQANRDLGLKMSGQTWQFHESVWIQGTQPEPAEYDYTLDDEWTVKATFPPPPGPRWTDRFGRELAAKVLAARAAQRESPEP